MPRPPFYHLGTDSGNLLTMPPREPSFVEPHPADKAQDKQPQDIPAQDIPAQDTQAPGETPRGLLMLTPLQIQTLTPRRAPLLASAPLLQQRERRRQSPR